MAEAWVEATEAHYRALEVNDKAAWEATLSPEHAGASSRGFWWKAGRDMVDKFGVKYVYKHVDEKQSTEKRKKVFFARMQPDGSQRGMPVPIHVALEGTAWKVVQASY